MLQLSRKIERDGLTVPRILIAIGLLSIVTTLVTPHLLAARERAETNATYAMVQAINGAVILYAEDHAGQCPTTGVSLTALVTVPQSGDSHWNGPYLENTLQDAWGNDFLYWCPGTYNRNSFDVSSAGPDGVHGNADDITNWLAR